MRAAVESARPLGLQQLDEDGTPIGSWTLVDILDISLGGVCLLIPHDCHIVLDQCLRVRLDVRSQPGLGGYIITGSIRWYVQSGLVMTLGIGFDDPLEDFPELLPDRRSHHRELDPDHWLMDEVS